MKIRIVEYFESATADCTKMKSSVDDPDEEEQKSPLLPSDPDYGTICQNTTGEITPTPKPPSRTSRVFKFLSQFYQLEPVVVTLYIATSSISVVNQNFYIDQICQVNFEFSKDHCRKLSNDSPSDEKLVEGVAANYKIFQNILELGIPVLYAAFLGHWTTIYGNRVFFLFSILGLFLSAVLYFAFSFFESIHPAAILVSSVPLAISGGQFTFAITFYSLITANSTTENRTLRFIILEVLANLSNAIGLLLGATLLTAGGYSLAYFVAGIFYLFTLIYGISVISCDTPVVPTRNTQNFCARHFDWVDLQKSYVIPFRKREGHRRAYILTLLACAAIFTCSSAGILSYSYLFTRNQLHWNATDFSTYSSVGWLISSVGGAALGAVARIFLIPDIYILLISVTAYVIANTLFTFATAGYQMYIGAAILIFSSIYASAVMSSLSKLVEEEERTSIFVLMTFLNVVMNLIASPIFGIVYQTTELYFPGAIYALCASMGLVILILTIVLYILQQYQNS